MTITLFLLAWASIECVAFRFIRIRLNEQRKLLDKRSHDLNRRLSEIEDWQERVVGLMKGEDK